MIFVDKRPIFCLLIVSKSLLSIFNCESAFNKEKTLSTGIVKFRVCSSNVTQLNTWRSVPARKETKIKLQFTRNEFKATFFVRDILSR